jgi:hypothetical protein
MHQGPTLGAARPSLSSLSMFVNKIGNDCHYDK